MKYSLYLIISEAKKGIYLTINWDKDTLQSDFNSDIGRIKQILMNLISNAYKFTNWGGITISIHIKRQVIGFERIRFLIFNVQDTGIGISEADRKGLFHIFGMIHKHRDQFNLKGTGLGLTITQKLVTMLGGEIKLESEENKGTSVEFSVKEKIAKSS